MKQKLRCIFYVTNALAFLLLSVHSMAQNVPELMYYKFDTPGTSVANDASSPVGTNPAPITGLTIGGTGQFGSGLMGAAGAAASNNVSPGWTGTHTGSWTISFWMNVPAPPTTRYMFGNSSGNGTFRCFIGGAANGIRLTGGVPTMTLDMPNWTSGTSVITYVYDQTAGTVSGYINGVFQASASPGSSYPLSGTNFLVGAQGTSIDGTMDEFRMYNRALTAAEITATWNIPLPGGPCTAPPTAGTTVPSTTTPCSGQTVNLGLTGNSYGTGQTYQWQDSIPASASWNNVGTSSSAYSTSVIPASTRYYRAAVTCSGQTTYSNPVLITVPTPYPGGTYTINSGVATGSGNFQTFADAVSAISCGISGPVVFNIASGSGPYNEQIDIPATVGSNATNTVTFNGNGVTLTSAGSSGNFATLNLDGADYITFKNMTITASHATNGFALHMMNNADNNTFDSCTFNASMSGTVTTLGCVSMSGSTTTYSTAGTNGSNNIFSNCSTNGGYFGFAFYGSAPSGNSGNKIINCSVKDYYVYGAYMLQQGSDTIYNNLFERPVRTTLSTFYGVMISTGCNNTLVEKNIVRNPAGSNPSASFTGYSLYCSAAASTGNENKFYNNLVGGINGIGIRGGLYLTGATYVKAYHNTIVLDHTTSNSSTMYGIYASGTAGVDIKNNNVVITQPNTGTSYVLYYSGAGKISNNNNLYIGAVGGTPYLGYYSVASPTTYTTLVGWQGAASGIFDQASTSADPLFPGGGNYTPTNALMNDIGTPVGITTDLYGAARSLTTPDAGAIEFSVAACSGSPVAGTAASAGNVASVCIGGPITLTLTGFTLGSGISIQWESSPAGIGLWTPISGATTSTLGTTLTGGATDYHAIVTCANGGGSDVSNTVSIAANPFYLCYCSPLTGVTIHSTYVNYITNVSIPTTTLNSSTTAYGPGGYTQLNPSTSSNTANLTQGQSYTINATQSTTYGVEMWIDWDQSGTFDASEYTLLSAANPASTTITIPVSAVPGMTGMRLRSFVTTAHGAGGACTSLSSGRETEDYVINIVPGVQCSGVPATAGTLSSTSDTICLGSNVAMTLSSYPTELGLSFQWESSPAGQSNFTTISGATGFSYTATALSASTDYRVAVLCSNPGGGTGYSNVKTITVTNPQLLSTTGATRCGVGTVNLSATPDAGSTVNWYNSASGGAPLATGTSTFTTPLIASTTNFYAAAVVGGGSSAAAPMPASTSSNAGTARGYWFTAPVSFTITGLQALGATGAQSIAVVRFNGNTPPPVYSTTTNAFTTLYVTQNNAITGVIPVNISVNAGDVIGVLGSVGTTTYYGGPNPYSTTIAGQSVALSRMGMQYALTTTLPQDLWQEPTSTYIGLIQMTYLTGCEGARVPVTATVTTPPAYTVSASPDTVCEGSSSTVSVNSANAYAYTWTPSGSGSSFSASPTTTTKYYVTGIDGNNCGIYDSVTVNVKSAPASVTTVASTANICVSGNVDLSLNPDPMYGIGIQWQKNTGSGYTNISGANGNTLTDAVTANTLYQANLYCNGNLVGTSTPVSVAYSNPNVVSTVPGSRCNAGPVTLLATPESGATISWFAASTGGSPLASSTNAFTTPSLSSTTTYYAAAVTGGGTSFAGPVNPAAVGAGGGTAAAITTYYMQFDVIVPTTLQSVDIYPTAAIGSNGAIAIQNSTGTTLITVPYTTTVTGGTTAQTIPINLVLPAGTGYKMGQSTAITLFRNTAGASYPYTSSAINIVSNNFGAGYYYYFYNWKFASGCEGARVPVTATINGAASGTGLSTGGTTIVTNQADGTTVDYMDACNDKVATVVDAAGGNALGNTGAIVLTSPAVPTLGTSAKPYVPRAFDITPSSNGPATVTLYALQSEFNAYNSYVTTNSLSLPLLPTSPTDVAGIANIVITQYHGAASAGTAGPGGLYANTNVEFIPNSAITASSNGTYWTLTFPVTGFSGFFIHTGSVPLSIELKSISAINVGNRNRVDWTTGAELPGDKFNLERSINGSDFSSIATINANGKPSSYSYWDENPVTGVNYYRIRMTDAAGKASYSRVVNATVKSGTFTVEAYPNPVSELLTVKAYGSTGNSATVTITDVTGKVVKMMDITNGMVQVNMSSLAQGMYLVKYHDSEHTQTIKVNKK